MRGTDVAYGVQAQRWRESMRRLSGGKRCAVSLRAGYAMPSTENVYGVQLLLLDLQPGELSAYETATACAVLTWRMCYRLGAARVSAQEYCLLPGHYPLPT